MDIKAPVCLISDTQCPFEHSRALEFIRYLKRHYRIPDENMVHVGDEADNYHGGRWPKDPDGKYSAVGELAITREKLREWGAAFPKMKLAISNHGMRWVKKATAAEIPSELLRSYQEILQTPPGWVWKHEWVFKEFKHPFRVIHGVGYNGRNGARNAAIDAGMSTAIGHLHSHAGIDYINTGKGVYWAFNTGSLIDTEAYAFDYGRESRFKPCLGAGVVFNSGSTPVWIPLET